MSRGSRVDALDALLGTASPRGDLVRVTRAGVHSNDLELPDRPADVDPCTRRRHGKLRGDRRCYGCGRTKNELALEFE